VEIQLASITTEQLEARTKDYRDDAIDVYWVLGKAAAASPHNKNWCKDTLGGFFEVVFTEHNEHLDITLLDEEEPHDGDAQSADHGAGAATGDRADATAVVA
jgi:hypothetical protein